MKSLICAVGAGLVALCVCTATAQASVVIGGTRVVFPAKDGEVTVRLTNQGSKPALVESWIDSGDAQSTPDKVDVPFLVTPPLFRLEPNKDQSLRIVATPAQLPVDRESLFWLNVLEVPPKPTSLEGESKNTLQFAVRSRLKLFYRPPNLPGDPLKAPESLTWKAMSGGESIALEIRNPTPYYVTLTTITVNSGGAIYSADSGMISPLSTLRVAVKDMPHAPSSGASIDYTALNDYGASIALKGIVSP
ncbi:molecular chaperone [Dyella solisilvae]|uniref:Molecular chaperone n=1 Tax=Dyella solisilvae TaxID=1920168 RepID=A0A370K3K0_9GAMM|nr:fimbria/pilus periplasmic chaperone [Dyella solisilvae]RDI97221.1 molecular chaperone [Dyella solisilvae]